MVTSFPPRPWECQFVCTLQFCRGQGKELKGKVCLMIASRPVSIVSQLNHSVQIDKKMTSYACINGKQ